MRVGVYEGERMNRPCDHPEISTTDQELAVPIDILELGRDFTQSLKELRRLIPPAASLGHVHPAQPDHRHQEEHHRNRNHPHDGRRDLYRRLLQHTQPRLVDAHHQRRGISPHA